MRQAAAKGVFVATSGLARVANDYVEKSSRRIVPIDGEESVRLMATHDIGARRKTSCKVKRVDEGCFDPEDIRGMSPP